jgi:hypothetical protein
LTEFIAEDRTAAEQRVLAATRRLTVGDAYYWIATGGRLRDGTDQNQLLRDLVALDAGGEDSRRAVLALIRSVLASDLDSAAVVFGVNQIEPAAAYRSALDGLARRCVGGTLKAITAESVLDAQRANPFTIEALCAVAALAYPDLRARAVGVPNAPDGDWTPTTMRAAFDVIDRIVRGLDTTNLPGAVPARPLDLISDLGATSLEGWEAIDHALGAGVPYEVLLAQRAVGGAWLAHRNSTSNLINRSVADGVAAQLERAQITFRRSTAVGGDIQPTVIRALARSDRQTGMVVLDRAAHPVYAITFATARDSGTARTSAARLRAMARDRSLPMALVLTGGGWSERNEIGALARDFGGRVFSEKGIAELIVDIKSVLLEASVQQPAIGG